MNVYTIDHRNDVGSWSISELPCASFIGLSHSAFIKPELRGRGLGKQQHKERLQRARDAFFTGLICTVNAKNKVEKHILRKNGWKAVHTFLNKEGEKVQLYVRNISQIGEP